MSTSATETSGTPTSLFAQMTAKSSGNMTTPGTWTTNKPSQALFYLAVVIGIFIAVLFFFFSLRYFVRSRMGMLFLSSLSPDLRGISSELLYSSFTRRRHLGIFDPHLGVGQLRFTPSKFSRRFRLTPEELEYLFPERTYQDWLNGGAEKDALERDIHKEIQYTDSPAKGFDPLDKTAEAETTDEGIDLLVLPSKPATDAASLHTARTIETVYSVHHPPENIESPHFSSGSCAICLEEFEDQDVVRGLICGHVFHKTCVDPWLSNRKACCPLCKRDYYLKSKMTGPENGSTDDHTGPQNFDFLSPEEVDRLRETDQNGNGPRAEMLELGWQRNGNLLQAYNEYLESVRPISQRAAEALVAHPELEEIAKLKVETEYYNWRYRFFWRLMGIKKQHLIDSIVVSKYNEIVEAERAQEESATHVEADGEDAAEATSRGSLDIASLNGTSETTGQAGAMLTENTLTNVESTTASVTASVESRPAEGTQPQDTPSGDVGSTVLPGLHNAVSNESNKRDIVERMV